ncbi:hypothetical protein C8J57DRAFT_1318808 [Mycena rebaudengoi]|nr:hypothetical protein C8J57DRAFT_1318808 [Mycena rebaudengoi]
MLDFLWPREMDGCKDAAGCTSSNIYALRSAERESRYELDVVVVLPLEIWNESKWDPEAFAVCDWCLSVMKNKHKAAKKSLWDRLPGTFGLPEWSELEKIKEEALK